MTDAAGVYRTANLICPKEEAAEELTQLYLRKDGQTVGTGEMQLFHQGKLSNTWGICRRQALKCKNCCYGGDMHNLYEEVPSTLRGLTEAASNLGWHVGLQKTTITMNECLQVPLAAYWGTCVTPRQKCNDKMCCQSS